MRGVGEALHSKHRGGCTQPTAWLIGLLFAVALLVAPLAPVWASASGVFVDVVERNSDGSESSSRWKLYGASRALVIGIDNYTNGWPRLSNAVKDAEAVAAALEERGFEVTLLTDVTGDQLRDQLRRFFAIQGRDKDARLFLWFAGHGHTENDEGYLVPADAPAPGSGDFLLSAYPMRDFGSLVRLANAKHSMAVFDSCFSGTVFTANRSRPPAAVTQATVRPVRQFLTSGDADQEVSDDGTFRAIFIDALLGEEDADANGDGYLTGTELSLHLETRVTNLSDGRQTPRSGKLRDRRYDQGDFVFLLPGRTPSQAPAGAERQDGGTRSGTGVEGGGGDGGAGGGAMELTFWQSIQDSSDPADFEAYLEAFPEGKFRRLAENKIKRLSSERTAEDVERAEALTRKAETLYFGEKGAAPDPAAAAETYRRAADRGNSDAQRMLGWLYQSGEGLEADPAKAAKWYKLAAAAGDADAQNNLGLLYAEGLAEGSESAPDTGAAVSWFERAALQGHVEAQINLGDAYRDGKGVAQDRRQAFEWYRRAAARNNRIAQARIARLYEIGLGERPDPREAARWLRKAGVRAAAAEGLQAARPSRRVALVKDEQEPNDKFGQANLVAAHTETKGAIVPKGDVDWYAIEVGHQGELLVLFADPPAELDMAFRVFNADYAALTSWLYAPAPGADNVNIVDLPAAGRYILEVRDGKNDQATPAPYSMRLTFAATADWAEPNDSFGDAASVELNRTYQANILPKGEADWYCFTAPHQGELTATFTDTPPALDMAVRVFNADKSALSSWFYPLKAGADTTARFDLKYPGRHCLEVRDGKNDARAIDPYTMTPQFIASKDLMEPNDSIGKAAEIALNESYVANILPKGDVDWYCFVAKDQGRLDILSPNPPATLDISARLWSADVSALTSWFKPLAVGGPLEATYDLAAPGRYCLEIRDGGNDSRAIEPYTLATRFTPTGDGFEPNDSFAAAKPVPTDATVTASLLPKGEVDWYLFEAKRQGRLEIKITDVPKTLDIALRLWDANKAALTSWVYPSAPGAETLAQFDLPSTGRFFLEVRDGKNDAAAPAPYTMTTRLITSD